MLFIALLKVSSSETANATTLEKDSLSPWTLDWLGMAYNGLEEHDDALETDFKAFNLSDGTVEVGGGLGHALGEAGEYELAK